MAEGTDYVVVDMDLTGGEDLNALHFVNDFRRFSPGAQRSILSQINSTHNSEPGYQPYAQNTNASTTLHTYNLVQQPSINPLTSTPYPIVNPVQNYASPSYGSPYIRFPTATQSHQEFPSSMSGQLFPSFHMKPKISTFSGQKDRHCSFKQWRYDVCALARPEPASVVMQCIRQSLKSPASDVLLNMGQNVSVNDILDKFQVTFGNVLPPEKLLEQFYTATQHQNETIMSWGCRLEDLVNTLAEVSNIDHCKEEMLRSKFWSGLRDSYIKTALRHLYDQNVGFLALFHKAREVEIEVRPNPPNATSSLLTPPKQTANPINAQNIQAKTSDPKEKELQHAKLREKRMKNITCYKCFKKGHYQRNCHENSKGDSEVKADLNSVHPV